MGDYVIASVEILIALSAFAVMWGVLKANAREHERRINELETNLKSLFERFNQLNDVYVNYRHFNETMTSIRETQRELREDIKKVIDLLSVKR